MKRKLIIGFIFFVNTIFAHDISITDLKDKIERATTIADVVISIDKFARINTNKAERRINNLTKNYKPSESTSEIKKIIKLARDLRTNGKLSFDSMECFFLVRAKKLDIHVTKNLLILEKNYPFKLFTI